jgi:hypothetical protein
MEHPLDIQVQVDFYLDTFRSGVVTLPYRLWHFDRHSKDPSYIYRSERAVYSYVEEYLDKAFYAGKPTPRGKKKRKLTLIQLKKLR